MSYRISTPVLDISLEVLPADDLRLHEHVLRDHVDRLAAAVERDGMLKNPVVVDGESEVVLDGMHRVTALRQLGLDAIPACVVPYSDPAIEVGSWVKRYDPSALAPVRRRCADADGHLSLRRLADGDGSAPTLTRPHLLAGGDRYVLDQPEGSMRACCARLNRLFEDLRGDGFEPELLPDVDLDPAVPPAGLAVVTGAPSKSAVVDAATTGALFPPNTSRHVIPTRPVGVDVPLDALEGTVEAANRRLTDLLEGREVEHRSTDSYEGRPYEEALVVFR